MLSAVTAAHAVAAALTRAPLAAHTDLYRVVDDAPDGCPGLVVDRYGPVLRLELRASRWPAHVDDVARALCDVVGAPHAVALLRTAGGASEMRVVVGDPPRAHVVDEGGVRLLVRCVDEDAAGAGVFVDHREGRRLVRAHVRAVVDAGRGASVLNLFAHAGAFGAVAMVAGARVDHVDAAKKCAPWAALNIALNGDDPKRHRFLVDDALAVSKRFAKRGPAYDVVICDPPTTAVRPGGGRFHVEKDLGGLARDCIETLKDGGLLILSTNDRALAVADVAGFASEAAHRAGRAVVSLDEIPLPDDVTTRTDAALRPMRGVAVVVR